MLPDVFMFRHILGYRYIYTSLVLFFSLCTDLCTESINTISLLPWPERSASSHVYQPHPPKPHEP